MKSIALIHINNASVNYIKVQTIEMKDYIFGIKLLITISKDRVNLMTYLQTNDND